MLTISSAIKGKLPPPPTLTGLAPLKVAITFYWLIGIVVFYSAASAISLVFTPNNAAYHLTILCVVAANIGLLGLLFHPRWGKWVVAGIAWYSIVALGLMSFASGGAFTPAYSAMVIPIILNGFLNGRRASIASFGLVLTIGGILLELENLSLLPAATVHVYQRVLAFGGYLALLTLTIDFIVRALQDIADNEQQQKEALLHQQQLIHDHDIMLAMLVDVSHQFLRGDTWEECMDMVLPKMGAAADADRIFVFEIVNNLGHEWIVTKRYEWAADAVPLFLDDPTYHRFEMRKEGFGRWIDVLSKGDIIAGNVASDYPPSERAFLTPRQISAQLVVPLYSYDTVWGFIGLDCQTRREWSSSEIDVLRALAEVMSAAIQRSDTRRQLFEVLSDEVQQNETLRRHHHEIETRDQLLRLLADLTSRLLEQDDWTALVESRLPDIATLTGADAVFLHQALPVGSDDWRLSRVFYAPPNLDLPPSDPTNSPTMRQMGLARWIGLMRRGEAIFTNLDDLPPDEQSLGRSFGTASMALMPIRTHHVWWGTITLITRTPHTWTAMQKDVLRAIADALGTAIQRRANHQRMVEVLIYTQEQNAVLTQQQQAIEQRDQLMAMVADISNAFLRHDGWLPVAEAQLPTIALVAGADRLFLYQAVDKPPQDWIVERLLGWRKGTQIFFSDPLETRFSLAEKGFSRWVMLLQQGESIISNVEDLPRAEQPLLRSLGSAAELVIPIMANQDTWGFISFSNEHPQEWNAIQITTLRTLADTLGAAIQRYEIRQRLMALLAQEQQQNTMLRYQKDEIQQRDHLISMVANVTRLFLGSNSWHDVLPSTIPVIGNAAAVDRIFLFEIVADTGETWIVNQVFGWLRGRPVLMGHPQMQGRNLKADGMGRWIELLGSGQNVVGHTKDLPQHERIALEMLYIQSQLLMPINIDNVVWGFIGYGTFDETNWTAVTLDALEMLADAMGAAIQRHRTHQHLLNVLAQETLHNEQLRQQQVDIERRDSLLKTVADMTRGFLGSETWDDVFVPMVEKIGSAMQVDRVFVWEIVERKPDDWIVLHRTSWHSAQQVVWSDATQLRRSLRADGLGRWVDVLQHGEPIIGNVKDFPASEQALQQPIGVAAQLIMPIMINAVVWGFIGFATHQPVAWTSVHQDVAKMLADTLGMAIQRSETRLRLIGLLATETEHNENLRRQQREIEQRDRLLNMVSAVTRRFLSSDTWQEVLPTVLPDIGRAAGVDRVFVFEVLEDTGDDWILRHVLAWHRVNAFIGADPALQRRSMKQDGLIRWREVMGAGAPIVGNVADFPASERTLLEAMGVHAQLVMPIWINETLWGIIGFAIERPFEWKPSHIDVLKTLADTVGAAIQLTQTRQWLMDAVAHEQEQNDRLRQQQHAIEQRDLLLRVLADSTKVFLQSETWEDVLPKTLRDIGMAMRVDRVCIYTLDDVSEDDWLVSQRFCWNRTDPDYSLDIGVQNIPVRAIGYMHHDSMMGSDDVVHGHVEDFPPDQRYFLSAFGVVTQLVMPVFVDNLPWGFIGYGASQRHTWPDAEIDALKTFADALGAAIQRYDARQRLIKSESELRAILTAIPDPLVRVDRQGNYLELYGSPSATQIFHRDDYLGKRVDDLWPLAVSNHYLQALNHYLDTNDLHPLVNQFDMELPIVGRRIVEITSVRWDDHSVLSLGRDITAAKLAEQRIASSEAKFRAIYEGSPDVVLVIDAETGIVNEVNSALTRILHLEATEIVNRPIQRLFRLADESLPAVFKRIQQEGAALGHTYMNTREGQRVPIDVAGAVVALPDGAAILLTLRDTTDRARIAELSVLLEKERELNTLRQQFIQTVSHEFRTPLAIIQLSDEILENYADRLTTEQHRSRHAMIRRQVEIMRAMVENVTRYGAVLQGVVLSPSEIEVEAFIETIIHDTDSLHERPRIGLTTEISTPTYYGDPSLLRQVVQNLINNALRYSKPEKAVFVWVASNSKHLKIRVADEGMGIPTAFLPDLFTPFRRAENVQTISGTGIGLAITKRIVDQHGGKISVESKVGQGTVFEVVLPQDAIPRVLAVEQPPTNAGTLEV